MRAYINTKSLGKYPAGVTCYSLCTWKCHDSMQGLFKPSFYLNWFTPIKISKLWTYLPFVNQWLIQTKNSKIQLTEPADKTNSAITCFQFNPLTRPGVGVLKRGVALFMSKAKLRSFFYEWVKWHATKILPGVSVANDGFYPGNNISFVW